MFYVHKMNKVIEEIAKEELEICHLESRNSDDLDFYEVSCWQIRKALKKAFLKGVEHQQSLSTIKNSLS